MKNNELESTKVCDKLRQHQEVARKLPKLTKFKEGRRMENTISFLRLHGEAETMTSLTFIIYWVGLCRPLGTSAREPELSDGSKIQIRKRVGCWNARKAS